MRKREKLIEQFGGCCALCGYNRCRRALHYHHTDASEKRKWSGATGRASLAEVEAHPERFELVCANCHIELHETLDRERKEVRTCLYCGREFHTNTYRVADRRATYCSSECKHAHRLPLAASREKIAERFWKYVRKTDGCWEWGGSKDSYGTGYLNVTSPDGKHQGTTAARVAYELHIGPIPKSRRVLHSCANNSCVNPTHLKLSSR